MRAIDAKMMVADDELHDLKLRLELLEGDRKAYYETSQFAIRQNREVITNLRSSIKEMGENVVKIKKAESTKLSRAHVERFGQKICEIHKRCDDLQSELRDKTSKVQEKHDKLEELRKEATMMKVEVEDSEAAFEIRKLENRLDKALIKLNETHSVRKTYQGIVKRMQEERLTFDRELAIAERTIKTKKQDATDLEVMSSDAHHARDVTKSEQTRTETTINEERELRTRELQFRKESVKAKMEEREAAQLRNVLTRDGGASEGANAEKTTADKIVDEDRERQATEYEEILRTVKEVMGVSDLDEVIEKFKSQKETERHLRALQTYNEARRDALREQFAAASTEDQTVRFSGENQQTAAQHAIAELNTRLAESATSAYEAKNRYERLMKTLTNAKSGVQHALDKLEGVVLDDVPASFKLKDDNIALALDTMTRKLDILYLDVTARDRALAASSPVTSTTDDPETTPSVDGVAAGGVDVEGSASPTTAPTTTTSTSSSDGQDGTTLSKPNSAPLIGGPSPIVTVAQAAILPANNCRVSFDPPNSRATAPPKKTKISMSIYLLESL